MISTKNRRGGAGLGFSILGILCFWSSTLPKIKSKLGFLRYACVCELVVGRHIYLTKYFCVQITFFKMFFFTYLKISEKTIFFIAKKLSTYIENWTKIRSFWKICYPCTIVAVKKVVVWTFSKVFWNCFQYCLSNNFLNLKSLLI